MQKKLVHEVKLQKSVIVILGMMAVGILGLAFKDYVTPAMAYSYGSMFNPIYINCSGCN